jgi:hypothetical protein
MRSVVAEKEKQDVKYERELDLQRVRHVSETAQMRSEFEMRLSLKEKKELELCKQVRVLNAEIETLKNQHGEANSEH